VNRYIARRLLQFFPVLLGALTLLFVALFILPGDPVQALLGERPVPPAFREAIIEKYGLDKPMPVQYLRYLNRLAHFDLGDSSSQHREVWTIIKERVPVTARLGLAGSFFVIALGVGSGLISAVRRYSWSDAAVTVGTIVLVSIPVFVLALMLQIFALKTKSIFDLPISGLNAGLKSYILPGFALGAVSSAYVSRLQRTSLLETLQADYVRTARSKGLRERRVVLNHAWRNALIPVVTYLGLDIGTLLTGAVLTESVFNIPGLGRTLAFGVAAKDNQVVLGISIFILLVYLVANLVVDILYAVLDPRIRYQ